MHSLRSDILEAAEQLAVPCTEAQAASLEHFVALLDRWNATYNLTAIKRREDMLVQHLFDCMAVVPAIERQLGGAALRLLDVGSGAGLPGVVLAVLKAGWDITCVDAVGKKAAFVQQVGMELGLRNLRSCHSRVESMRDGPFQLITSRAFASLVDMTSLTSHLLAVDGLWMAMKGKAPAEEIAALPDFVDMFHVEQLRVPELKAERCLVWMRRPHLS